MKTIELILDEKISSNYYMKEAFNSLRANILFSKKDVKTIVLTSCLAHEGKSSVCFELCRSLAEAGKKILLVDADMRKSVMITRYTNNKGLYGLSHLLSGQIEAEEAICKTNVANLDIVFAGPYPPNPTELIGSPAFEEFLNAYRDAYDYIIVDAPPLGLVVDAAVISNVCDGSVLVVNVGHIKYRMAQNVIAQLEKSGRKILGVILNQVDRKKTIKSEYSLYAAYLSEDSQDYYAKSGHTKKK